MNRELLETLHSVPGVQGCFCCSYDGKLLASTMEATSELAKAGYAMSLGVRMLNLPRTSPVFIYGTFSKGRVLVRTYPEGLLVVLGEVSTRQLLLKAAVNEVIKRLNPAKDL